MKKKLLIGICALSIAAQTSATVITVSNNPNSPGQYTDLQAAVDAASNGDTLLIAGSGTSYGGVDNFSKQLHFVGVGYEPNKDLPLKTEIGPIQLGVVDANENASGSTVEGISFHGLNLIGTATVPLQNITVKRCESSGAQGQYDQMFRMKYVENIVVYNNVLLTCNYVGEFNGSSNVGVNASLLLVDNTTCNNVFIENNLCDMIQGGVVAGGTFIVKNNIFIPNGNSGRGLRSPSYAIITNNIFLKYGTILSPSYCTYTNNLSFDTGSPAFPNPVPTNISANNLEDVNPVFEIYNGLGLSLSNAWSLDFHLQSGSPAIGAGLNGEDLGIYGGNYPWPDGGASGSGYMYRQEPQFPQVNQMTIQNSVVPLNGTLNVTSRGIVND